MPILLLVIRKFVFEGEYRKVVEILLGEMHHEITISFIGIDISAV